MTAARNSARRCMYKFGSEARDQRKKAQIEDRAAGEISSRENADRR